MPPMSLLEDPFSYYSPIYCLVFQVAPSLRFPHKTLYAPLLPPYVLHALPIYYDTVIDTELMNRVYGE